MMTVSYSNPLHKKSRDSATRQRQITAVDGTGRQHYRQVQVMQLMLWALELVRTVWRMPRYRRASWLTRTRPASQMHLFD